MDEQSLEAFKQNLISKYSGTFNTETEQSLKQLNASDYQVSKYHMIAANCAIYILQKTQEVSTNTLDFFRQCNYHRYLNLVDTLEFKAEYGDAIRKIKSSVVELIDATLPDTYIQLGFPDIIINKSAVCRLEISDFFTQAQCSHLEIPVLLNRAGMDYFYWTVENIQNNTIEHEVKSEEMVIKLSTILIASHGLFNMFFNYKQFEKG